MNFVVFFHYMNILLTEVNVIVVVVYYFCCQRALECDVLDRLKASVPEEASDVHQSINCNTADDDGLHAVRELVLVCAFLYCSVLSFNASYPRL